MQNLSIVISFIFISLLNGLSSCNSTQGKAADNLEKKQYTEEKNPVTVMVLKRRNFEKELLSNGKLKAIKKSVLKFETSGILKQLFVKNGQYIAAGKIIARLDNQKANQKLENSRIQLEKAKLTREELLIGQGYDNIALDSIPENILQTANIRSGYAEALINLQQARYTLNSTVLKAPFSGKIAGLQSEKYNRIEAGKDFCTLIDDHRFEVAFEIMESELNQIYKGQKVSVIPFSQAETYNGYITEINPMVEKNGMIKIKAVLKNTGKLIDGMNVKVLIKNTVKNRLVVPKSAVLLRQNKEVVFRYKSGLAYWTYVKTIDENSKFYTIIANKDRGAEINEGDTVIISGNLNLAHESKVEITDN
jgi:RND family efflux transporter MFP subunit